MAAALNAHFTKRRGGFTLEAAFTAGPGVTALVGPSGSGKTTLLRCLAGLERPDAGHIAWEDARWFDAGAKLSLAPQARRVGLIFQDHALFPHLTVEGNVAFGARDAGRVNRTIESFELEGLARRYPRELSAGQAQRVAIARAVAASPRILLMDEPFASLDAPLKERLYQALGGWLAEWRLPVVLVTHDWSEAARLAERLVVLDQGRIAQADTPEAVLYRPASPAVASLTGIRHVHAGVAVAPDALAFGPHRIAGASALVPGQSYGWCVRPDQVALAESGLPAVVRSVVLTTGGYRVEAEVEGAGMLELVVPREAIGRWGVAPGYEVRLALPAVHVFTPAAAPAPRG